MPHRGVIRCVMLLVCGALVLAGCAPAAPKPVTIRVVNQPFISFAPYHIALAEGYFAEQGITAELVDFVQTQEIIPALLSGQVDVAAGLMSAGILNTIARGGELVITADKGYIDPAGCDNLAILARAALFEAGDPGTADGLRGRTINVVAASWNEYYLDRALQTVGLAPADVVKTNIPTPAQPDAMAQGTLDFTVQNEPWVLRLANAGHEPVLTPVTQLLPESQTAVMFYGPNLLGDNAEVGERFMVAYLKAVRQYNAGKTERNLQIISDAIGLDVPTLQAMCWPALRADGTVDTASLLDFQAWALEAGHVEQSLTIEQMYDPQFAEAAAPKVGQANP